MDDLNAQRRASGKLPYSTGTEFVVNKFRMHFFHGSDLHDGTGVEDNFVLLLSLQSLAGGNFLGGTRRSDHVTVQVCLLYTSPSPRDMRRSRMPSSA